jgi:hypothetical protein
MLPETPKRNPLQSKQVLALVAWANNAETMSTLILFIDNPFP